MKIKKNVFMVLLALGFWFGLTGQAITPSTCYGVNNFDANEVFPKWDETMDAAGKKILGKNGAGDIDSLAKEKTETQGAVLLVVKAIEIILSIIAPLVIIMSIWSGILFVTAGGDEESVSKAKRFFLYAVVGFVFIIISFTLVKIATNVLQ